MNNEQLGYLSQNSDNLSNYVIFIEDRALDIEIVNNLYNHFGKNNIIVF